MPAVPTSSVESSVRKQMQFSLVQTCFRSPHGEARNEIDECERARRRTANSNISIFSFHPTQNNKLLNNASGFI